MPVQKAKDFKGTLRRLTGYLEPHRPALIVVVVAGVIATLFSVIGPKMLGLATTRIFEGYLARTLGASNAGIDFAYVGHILLDAAGPVRGQRRLSVPAAVPDVGRGAEHGLRAAPATSRRSSAACRSGSSTRRRTARS